MDEAEIMVLTLIKLASLPTIPTMISGTIAHIAIVINITTIFNFMALIGNPSSLRLAKLLLI
jgi:hypothetical protein